MKLDIIGSLLVPCFIFSYVNFKSIKSTKIDLFHIYKHEIRNYTCRLVTRHNKVKCHLLGLVLYYHMSI